MTNYKRPYFRLFCAVCDTIDDWNKQPLRKTAPKPLPNFFQNRRSSCEKSHRKQRNWSLAAIPNVFTGSFFPQNACNFR